MPGGKSPLFVFAGGGTGGHLFPALSIVEALRQREPDLRVLFFGTDRALDEKVLGHTEYQFVRQELPGLTAAPWRWPAMLSAFVRARRHCRELFCSDCPVAVVGTGGISSIPAVREAVRAGIPAFILNPDAVPGRANRLLAGQCDAVFVQWEESVEWLPRSARAFAYGCPVRSEFNRASKMDGIERFHLDPGRKTLLVTGASQGARSINEAVLASADLLAARPDWQILHITGQGDFPLVRDGYRGSADLRARVRVVRFTFHMAEALAACDLLVSRAGASSLAEITAVGRAGILMPYPFHRDQHQLANARCLVRCGAARIVRDRMDPAINGPQLGAVLDELMGDDSQREAMAAAARRVGCGQAAARIAEHLLDAARDRGLVPMREKMEVFC